MSEREIRRKIAQELRSSAFLHTDVNKEHVILCIKHGCSLLEALVREAEEVAGCERETSEHLDETPAPIDMILHCPKCGMQHVDKPGMSSEFDDHTWDNPPHRSHLCAGCGHIWRPADVATNGVESIKTFGKDDSPEIADAPCETEEQAFAMEALMQFVPEAAGREDGRVLLTPAQVEALLRTCGWVPPGEQRPEALSPIEREGRKTRRLIVWLFIWTFICAAITLGAFKRGMMEDLRGQTNPRSAVTT